MPPAPPPTRGRLLARLRRQGSLSRRDLDAERIHPRWLRRLQDEGVIERVRPGVYRAAVPPETTDQTLFEACAAVPMGVICMTSALAYHRLSTVNPSQIEMAVPRDHRKPVVAYPPIRFYEFRDMTTGLERVRRRGAELRIFNAERSIADAFRLRHEIGKDVALEALQTYLRRRSGRRVETLLSIARQTGAFNVIRPYVEALV
jgi:predicted transcriptional regulator of viral defense system